MVQADYAGAGVITSYNTAAAATVTVTLPTPGTGQANRIMAIYWAATGATLIKIQVTKNDGTTVIGEMGGTGVALPPVLFPMQQGSGIGGLVCVAADAAKVILTATTANPCSLTVLSTMSAA